MRVDPTWLSATDLVALNRGIVEATGEPHTMLSANGLEAAVAAPIHKHHYEGADLLELAVRLIFSVGTAHAFGQGNKRTAYFGAMYFLESNGATFAPPDTEDVAKWIEALITHDLNEVELASLLRPYVVLP